MTRFEMQHAVQTANAIAMAQQMVRLGGKVEAWADDMSDFIPDERGLDILKQHKFFGLLSAKDCQRAIKSITTAHQMHNAYEQAMHA